MSDVTRSALECSPAKPWGLHAAVTDSVCPRCGWSTGRRRAHAYVPKALPARLAAAL